MPPAVSRKQRKAAAIAEHASPDEIANAGPAVQQMAKMPADSLHDFAATPEKKLPEKVHHKKHRGDHRSGGRQKRERGDYSK